ncbi:hypothetical protein [Nocardiopsis sp. YSL2]|uniref:hypothetical protein n=1 Tax=Nocardiopsis sp. YSL2 TaxID=2939492 RepID=UPI0026F41E54|nr:hypothetical protein [Nocardiopsis sp. YSL2]
MKPADHPDQFLVTARRLLVGGAIAAAAVFGTAACEDTGDDDPAVEEPGDQEDTEDGEEDGEEDAPGGY